MPTRIPRKLNAVFAQGFCVLAGLLLLLPPMASATEYRVVEIPKAFMAVNFSRDGEHVAFSVKKDGKFHAAVDGKEGPSYENLTAVDFSPQTNLAYYAGKRGQDWYLVRDGKEIAKLMGLTSLVQATGLNDIGSPGSVTISIALPIWFAEKAESYFVLCYQNGTGRIFKDGSFLSVKYNSFWNESMAMSPDGSHYAFAVAPAGARIPRMYIDGVAGPEIDKIDGATYLQPGDRLVYRGERHGDMTLMEGDKPLKGYGPLANAVKVSKDHRHLAACVKKEGGKLAVVVDGKEETAFPNVDWGYSGFFSGPGSFTWNKDFSSHAYVAYLTAAKTSPVAVIHDGKVLESYPEIRAGSLAVSDDGKHVAYIVKRNDQWAVAVDGVLQESFKEVDIPVFVGSGSKVAYAAKTSDGWVIKGISTSAPFSDVSPLVRGPGNEIAYAAKSAGGKWQVFVDSKPVSRPFDGIVAQTGVQFDGSGSIRFVAREGTRLFWIRTK